MRWLVIVMMLAGTASARMLVIEEPGMYYACPSGKTWAAVEKCLKGQGRPVVIKELQGAKLVRLDQQENGAWVDAGIYLYAEVKSQWKITGGFFGRGTEYELTDFKPHVVGKHAGFRVEIAQASPLYVQLDGLTTRPATRRVYQTLYCSPARNYCTQVVRSCEVLVHGSAYWTFRGRSAQEGDQIVISGDRKLAGPFCAQAERVYLGWPQPN